MAVVTVTIADNPLAGQAAQNDVTVTISSDPDLPLGPDGQPDESKATLAMRLAGAMVAQLPALVAEVSVIRVNAPNRGSMN